MRCALFVGISLGVQIAFAQFTAPLIRANAEYDYLFQRVARSSIVVSGKVVERKPIWKRGVPHYVEEGSGRVRTANMEDITGGALFTMEIGEPLCRQQDFTTLRVHTDVPEGTVHIFVPYDRHRSSDVAPGISMPHEQLFKGQEYLLFLVPYPRQKELVEKNELDTNLTYYRAYDGYMGALKLPDAAVRQGEGNYMTRFMGVVKSFCEAVQPVDPAEKITRLRALRGKADRRWIDSVDAAIRSLEEETKP